MYQKSGNSIFKFIRNSKWDCVHLWALGEILGDWNRKILKAERWKEETKEIIGEMRNFKGGRGLSYHSGGRRFESVFIGQTNNCCITVRVGSSDGWDKFILHIPDRTQYATAEHVHVLLSYIGQELSRLSAVLGLPFRLLFCGMRD